MIKRLLIITILGVLVASCGTRKKEVEQRPERERQWAEPKGETRESSSSSTDQTFTTPSHRMSVDEYIATYAKMAQDEMREYKIPASITLAQGILESGAGNGDLTRRANNHFGIKCHDWKGAKVYHDDDARGECFRKYAHPSHSFRDHSLFLAHRQRYASLFDLKPDDYKAWARGLRNAGYATDRKYPDKLISLIERYQLYLYDAEVLGQPGPVLAKNNRSQNDIEYRVQQGDTLYSISRRYNMSVEEIQRKNNLNGTNLAIGQILYLGSSK